MNQGGRVDHLDNGAEDVVVGRDAAAGFRGQQQQDRTEAFAAVVADVVEDFGNAAVAAVQALHQDAFHLVEIPGDGAWRSFGAGAIRVPAGITCFIADLSAVVVRGSWSVVRCKNNGPRTTNNEEPFSLKFQSQLNLTMQGNSVNQGV